jgi:hypothetical protein
LSHRVRRFERKISGESIAWEQEKHKPKTSNLVTHLKDCTKFHEAQKKASTDAEASTDTGPGYNLQQSRDIMEEFLCEGKLNPAIVPTKSGFLKLFAMWILDEDLPWTTGESLALQDLFKYLKISYQLPSDRTVRNELTRIFADLHGKVVKEFVVRHSYSVSFTVCSSTF